MTDTILSMVKFENYAELLRTLLRDVTAMGVFTQDGQAIWFDSHSYNRDRAIIQAHVAHWVKDERISRNKLESGETLYEVSLGNVMDEPAALLVVLVQEEATAESGNSLIAINSTLNTIADCIETEIQLTGEVDSMANELANRYEELNLVYEADDQIEDMHLGEKSLQHLVESCKDFLGVGMAVLMLPEKQIAIHDLNEVEFNLPPQNMLSALKTDLYAWMKKNRRAVVLNNFSDPLRNKICPDHSCKILSSPVETGESGVMGILTIINHRKKPDFTNSDRNLLDVMAKRVSKIVQASFDPLTGLINFRNFEWRLGEALAQAHLSGVEHTILNIDLDRTKVINDVGGHEIGNELIRQIGETIKNMVRSGDSVARLSGDKFGVLLENCPLEVASRLAQDIRGKINGLPFELEGESFDVSVSIGVAPLTADSGSVAGALSAVEVARDAAKERGRNQLQIFKQDDVVLLRRRDEMHWVGRIQSALREDRFQLYAQLIQPLKSEVMYPHYEILLRMLSEEGEVVPPGAFLPAAEHYHLMPGIDRWVIERALTQLSEAMPSLTAPCHIALNLSGQTLCDDGFQQFIIDRIDRSGVPAEWICFEITESAAITNLNEAKTFIADVKAKGARFSLDDFGTGLSSFAYLKNLDVDYLKIDGTFVREIENDPVSRTMVSAINQVGHAMGLQTIAEFVENDEIRKCLIRQGVDYGQGYGLGKPQPFAELLRSSLAQPVSPLAMG